MGAAYLLLLLLLLLLPSASTGDAENARAMAAAEEAAEGMSARTALW